MPNNKNKITKSLIILTALVGVLFVSNFLFAQVNVGLEPMAQTGLPTGDIRVTIANVIRFFLGFLGIVGVALVLYGGFIWMTAAGNEEKISTAKKILLNAGIGLVIIISAYALTSFILTRLAQVTGVPEEAAGPAYPGFPPGVSPADSFLVRDITPIGQVPIRNINVRIIFNRTVDELTVANNVTVKKISDDSSINGTFSTAGTKIEFIPSDPCPEPNQNLKCFAENTEYSVELKSGANGLKSAEGKELICGIAGSKCKSNFTSGSLVDTMPPTVRIINPVAGQSVSVDEIILVEAQTTDDAGISYVEFYADDSLVDTATPGLSTSPISYNAQVNWDTTGLALGSLHTLKAKAYDIDNNSADSSAISVNIRAAHCFDGIKNETETGLDCGGADCGKCDGESCTQDSECSSGTCINGVCSRMPKISDLDPQDGGPGNYVSILGEAFRSSPGTVIFMGDPLSSSDDKTAVLADCAGNWQDSQVIVKVPDGAVDGPIKLTTSGNLTDQTNDALGWQGDFDVNDKIKPGLCSINPLEGEYGSQATIEGNNLGAEKAILKFKDTAAESIATWTNTKIEGVTVPNLNPEKVLVSATVNNIRSNSLNFVVKSSTTAPRISYLDPVAGPAGQYITVFGANFGTAVGSVKFVSPEGVEMLADTSFPENCQKDFWHHTYINIKVPNAPAGDYKVKVVKGVLESNLVDFKINNSPKTPGVCLILPDNGPVGIEVTFYGERFGSTSNKIRFFRNQENSTIISWANNEIHALVPPMAQTGPVEVIDSTGTLSNSVNYLVATCSQTSCAENQECCPDGSCRAAGTCKVIPPACIYSWAFTTGDGGIGDPCGSDEDCLAGLVCDPETKTCQSGYPKVVIDEECILTPQSPSPWKGSTDACVNSGISARFNMDMKESTLNSANIILKKCNTGSKIDESKCTENVDFSNINIVDVTDKQGLIEKGFLALPQNNLAVNTWYQVTLTANILSASNLALSADYVWSFRTRNDSSPCQIDHLLVSPQYKTLIYKYQTQDYLAEATAANCNTLNPSGYVWNWTSSDSSKASVLNNVLNTSKATALNETLPETPVLVTSSIPAQDKSDNGELTIDYSDPEVLEYWPACKSACVNSAIGAKFNVDMDKDTLNLSNVKLYSCADEKCTTLGAVSLSNIFYNEADLEMTILPSSLLQINKYYRVVLLNGIKSSSNVALTKLNYSTTPGGSLDSFSWIFKTKNDQNLCTIDNVTVSPDYQEIYLIGLTQNYYSNGYGSPDECNASGQRLNPYFYNWAWLSSEEKTAAVTNDDLLPKDNNIDPLQIATAKGEGEAGIQAEAQNKSGEGTLKVVCGFTADNQCPPPAALETYGVGSDTCCYPRPKVVRTNPPDGSIGVCRNLVIEAEFDQPMELGSILGNVAVEANYGEQACPTTAFESSVLGKILSYLKNFWAKIVHAQTQNWCPVKGQTTAFNDEEKSSLEFYTAKELEPNREYRAIIKGDKNLTDELKEGVKSLSGLMMNNDYIWKFTAGDQICDIDYVEVIISPPGEVGTYDLYNCAGRDDCPGDQDSITAGVQHRYRAKAKDETGVMLPATFEWLKTGPDVIRLSSTSGEQISVTAEPTNGKPLVSVIARGIPPTPGTASKTINIIVFMCENPWPTIKEFPYKDFTTNFSTFYCRDAGEKGFADDLPGLSAPPPVTPTDPNIIKEYLFFVE